MMYIYLSTIKWNSTIMDERALAEEELRSAAGSYKYEALLQSGDCSNQQCNAGSNFIYAARRTMILFRQPNSVHHITGGQRLTSLATAATLLVLQSA